MENVSERILKDPVKKAIVDYLNENMEAYCPDDLVDEMYNVGGVNIVDLADDLGNVLRKKFSIIVRTAV